jgi:hypothetical protein
MFTYIDASVMSVAEIFNNHMRINTMNNSSLGDVLATIIAATAWIIVSFWVGVDAVEPLQETLPIIVLTSIFGIALFFITAFLNAPVQMEDQESVKLHTIEFDKITRDILVTGVKKALSKDLSLIVWIITFVVMPMTVGLLVGDILR